MNQVAKSYPKLQKALENDIMGRFPTFTKHVNAIHIDNNPISASMRGAGLFMQQDSNICTKEALPKGFNVQQAMRIDISDATKRYIDRQMDSLIKSGMSEADAHKKVQDSLEPVMGFDKTTGQYVMGVKAPLKARQQDSLLEQTSIPMWNIGWLTKIFKQPFATSHAKNLVSVESFSNPWCTVIGMFKESFEGYGKLSSTAKGNMKQNNSNPVTNEASQIVDEIYSISIDYESDLMEDIMAAQPGNFITGQIKSDREKYASMVLDRMQDALIYFGSDEAGIDGLADVATVDMYTGTPLYSILKGTSTTKGSDIVQAMNDLINDYMRENHYMARKVVINVSEYVFESLIGTVYSQNYNPSSPLQILTGNFKGAKELDGGLYQVSYTIISDTMLNPSIAGGEQNPFNPNNYDYAFITTPTIQDAMGTQDSLIIHPEPLKSFIMPTMWQRSGLLYTQYKRIGGVIAPIAGTVKVVCGLGYKGN